MGVPGVSLAGQTGVSRAGKTILHAANLSELARDTPERFVRAAAELAGDVDCLRLLRTGMRDRLLATPLLDHPPFARTLEAAYRRMWREWAGNSDET
jgi:protein O-GlcNAc transferase